MAIKQIVTRILSEFQDSSHIMITPNFGETRWPTPPAAV